MVAKIITGKSIVGALNYNEHKVQKGKAELIKAHLYPKPEEQLNLYEKLARLANLTALNQQAKTNCVHISLNFDPSEQLSKEQLNDIAESYMQKIGFGMQPFLTYQHFDAGHGHVHIVTTNIQKDGSRIELHNIGKTLSEPARKEIEKEFDLVVADSKNKKQLYSLKPVLLEKAEYGKTETKKVISDIVREVTRSYKFTSLPELNAVLRQFNVTADQGKEGTKMRAHGGLHYSIVDSAGNLIGVPIKASRIYGNPTLKVLEEKFEYNQIARKEFKEGVKKTLSGTLYSLRGMGREKFTQALKQKGFNAVFHENKQGFVYGVTYIDNVNRCVFKGSDLGKEYSAKALTEHLEQEKPVIRQNVSKPDSLKRGQDSQDQTTAGKDMVPYSNNTGGQGSSSYLPHELSKDKKKKKRRSL